MQVQSLGCEDPLEEEMVNPLQYSCTGKSHVFSCLENPTDRGAWWAAVHGVAKSRARLSADAMTRWQGEDEPSDPWKPGLNVRPLSAQEGVKSLSR